jgi:acetyl esterase/lipase
MAPIHPRLQEYIEALDSSPVLTGEISLEKARKNMAELLTVPEAEQEPIGQVIEEGNLTLFIPEGEGPFPVTLFFHGGGMVFGSTDVSSNLCRKIASRTPCIVVSVNYSLSPEVQYPLAIEECYAATQWVYENISRFNGDPTRLAVAGESAGGALATLVALHARDRGGPPLCFQLLLQPVASFDYGPSDDHWLVYPEKADWYWDQYNPEREPLSLPIHHPSLKDLPPAFFLLAEHDILTQGALQLLDRMDRDGVAATGRVFEGMTHAFCGMPFPFPPGDAALDEGIMHLREEFER